MTEFLPPAAIDLELLDPSSQEHCTDCGETAQWRVCVEEQTLPGYTLVQCGPCAGVALHGMNTVMANAARPDNAGTVSRPRTTTALIAALALAERDSRTIGYALRRYQRCNGLNTLDVRRLLGTGTDTLLPFAHYVSLSEQVQPSSENDMATLCHRFQVRAPMLRAVLSEVP